MFLISTNHTLKRKTKMNHFVHFKINQSTQHRNTDLQCKVRQAVFSFYQRLFSSFFFFLHQHQFKSTMLGRRGSTALRSAVINLSTTGQSIVTATFGGITATTELKVESRQQHTDEGGWGGASSLSPPPHRLKHRINAARHPREETSVAPWWCRAERLGQSCWWAQQIQSYNLTAKATFIHFSVVQHNRNFTIILTVNINRQTSFVYFYILK